MATDPRDAEPSVAKSAREARQAQALRANLRRRKAQTRAQPAPETESEVESVSPPDRMSDLNSREDTSPHRSDSSVTGKD